MDYLISERAKNQISEVYKAHQFGRTQPPERGNRGQVQRNNFLIGKAVDAIAVRSGVTVAEGTVSLFRNVEGTLTDSDVDVEAINLSDTIAIAVDDYVEVWQDRWGTYCAQSISEWLIAPIALTQTGGSDGSSTTQASWTYTVTHHVTGATLGTVVGPTTSPHRFIRPTLGKIVVATHGLAYLPANGGAFQIFWINETPSVESC